MMPNSVATTTLPAVEPVAVPFSVLSLFLGCGTIPAMELLTVPASVPCIFHFDVPSLWMPVLFETLTPTSGKLAFACAIISFAWALLQRESGLPHSLVLSSFHWMMMFQLLWSFFGF